MASVVDEDDDGVECQGHHGRLVDEHLLHKVGGGVPLVEVYNDLFWEAHMMAHDGEHGGEYDEEHDEVVGDVLGEVVYEVLLDDEVQKIHFHQVDGHSQ